MLSMTMKSGAADQIIVRELDGLFSGVLYPPTRLTPVRRKRAWFAALLRFLFPPIDRRADRRTMLAYFRSVLIMYYWCILGALTAWWVMIGVGMQPMVYR